MSVNDVEMMEKDESVGENLRKSYLAAYQTLLFSKSDKTDSEIADIERRCLFTKYMICKKSIGKEAAAMLLQNDLNNYTSLVDSRNGLNNYWQQFSQLNITTDNNPTEWESKLTDPNCALQFLEPVPCTSDKTLSCKNKQFTDRDVEKLMDLWKNSGSSPRMRKVSRQEQNNVQNHTQNKNNFENKRSDSRSKLTEFKFVKKSPSPQRKEEPVINTKQQCKSPIQRSFPIFEKKQSNSERQDANHEKQNISSEKQSLHLEKLNSNFNRESSNSNTSNYKQNTHFNRLPSNSERQFGNSDKQHSNTERQYADFNKYHSHSERQFSNSNKQYSNPDRQYSNSEKQYSTPDRQYSNSERQFGNSNRQYSNNERFINNKSNFPQRAEPTSIERKEEKVDEKKFTGFQTARTTLQIQQANKNNRQQAGMNRQQYPSVKPPIKKSLGGRAAVNSAYINPFQQEPKEEEPTEPVDERLKNVDAKMIELIKNEIMDCGKPISWDDIAGLQRAKKIIQEIVVYPMLRPDIFTGLRRPPKGILLFGPPGTGKTLIGKCIASQSKSTFFSISASSLTSKWVGEGEKMVRALFAVAQVEQPSVVFIDEIDSLLCQRSETEHESSRRMKTEFLVQLDGAATGDEDRILVIGATNRPYELDEAARRRLVKRLYIPLPEQEARAQIVRNLLRSESHDLTEDDVQRIAELANGYSGADMTNLCKEASMGPIRSIPFDQLEGISQDDVRKVTFEDFKEALDTIRPSVSPKDLDVYLEWDRTYGTASAQARG